MLKPSAIRSSQGASARAWKKNPVEYPHDPAPPECGMTMAPDCSASPAQRAATLLTAAVIPVLIGPCVFAYLSSKRYHPDVRGVKFDRSSADGKPQSLYCAIPSMTRIALPSFELRVINPESGT